ncbi:MAG TPA: hypothetical protein VFC63_17070 [Blastocatellia bacterium]|nr:hypothetical protein [Blastocatellia bacterium]
MRLLILSISAAISVVLMAASLPSKAFHLLPQVKGRFSNAGLGEKEVQQFFKQFQDAIEKNDKRQVASMISYPITVSELRGRRNIKNDASFIKDYDAIFDPKFRDFIVNTKFEELWSRDQGVATAGGEIWIGGVIKDPAHSNVPEIKVIAINGLLHKR